MQEHLGFKLWQSEAEKQGKLQRFKNISSQMNGSLFFNETLVIHYMSIYGNYYLIKKQ